MVVHLLPAILLGVAAIRATRWWRNACRFSVAPKVGNQPADISFKIQMLFSCQFSGIKNALQKRDGCIHPLIRCGQALLKGLLAGKRIVQLQLKVSHLLGRHAAAEL
ncbi:hypothetical protein SAMN04490192_2931 [Pseudomonas lundensis]|nr:hypothetical protein SAMN04490192_2931 [Pseudomonas lundensis]